MTMNLQDQLKIAKLATKLMTDYPTAKTPMARLQWIKQANELLKLKLQQPEPVPIPEVPPVPEVPEVPEKEETIFLQQVIDQALPDMTDTFIGSRISEIIKGNPDDDSLIKLSQKAVDTYKQAFFKQAKRYQWGK